MIVRARCNRRSCQARKTFRQPLAWYQTWPICHVCREGKMYEDTYRNRVGANDGRRMCTCDGYVMSQRNAPHRYGSPSCRYREEYLLEMSFTRGTKKHSPNQQELSLEPGF